MFRDRPGFVDIVLLSMAQPIRSEMNAGTRLRATVKIIADEAFAQGDFHRGFALLSGFRHGGAGLSGGLGSLPGFVSGA